METRDDYLTPEEAARLVGMAPKLVWTLVHAGKITAHHPVIVRSTLGLRLKKDELLAVRGRSAKRRATQGLGAAQTLTDIHGDVYLTPHEAAKMMHVSVATIWRWLREGTITGYHPTIAQPTRGIRVTLDELHAAREAGKKAAA